jgi:hypothetical protein
MDIYQRIALFYQRLGALPAFESHDQALAEIARVLTEVEDEHSCVPRDPSGMPAVTGGRMYPPVAAYARATDIQGVIMYAQKGHRTYISDDGAVLIVNKRTEAIEFEKPGRTGRRIEL